MPLVRDIFVYNITISFYYVLTVSVGLLLLVVVLLLQSTYTQSRHKLFQYSSLEVNNINMNKSITPTQAKKQINSEIVRMTTVVVVAASASAAAAVAVSVVAAASPV